jgi:alanine dehydrogenase
MSEVAGRMAVQIGAQYLEAPNGGRGILLAGVPGGAPANVVILGGGVVGHSATKIAVGMGANVTVIDKNLNRLRQLDDIYGGLITTLASNHWTVTESLKHADLVIGAVLIPGAKTPKLITRPMLKLMKPGTVIVDIAVDQGGCCETTHPTTHADPVFLVAGIVHYCVANMPGAYPRSSTFALTNATLPFGLQLAGLGWKEALRRSAALAKGANLIAGKITYEQVAAAHSLPYTPLEKCW